MKYREQSKEELLVSHEELSKTLYHLRNERKETGKIEKPHQVKATRREIARVLTVLREKEGQV